MGMLEKAAFPVFLGPMRRNEAFFGAFCVGPTTLFAPEQENGGNLRALPSCRKTRFPVRPEAEFCGFAGRGVVPVGKQLGSEVRSDEAH